MLGVLDRRYHLGHEIFVRGAASSRGDCREVYVTAVDEPLEAYVDLPTVIHECGHYTDHDLDGGSFADNAYLINLAPLEFFCHGGDAVERGDNTFAVARIYTDMYQDLLPNDGLAPAYLGGDPDDTGFQLGDQGVGFLLEETTQYINYLVTAYSLSPELSGRSNIYRDGTLSFLWYITRYLRMARLEYPSACDYIVQGDDGCWRQLILTLWGRAWLYLETT